MDAPPAATRSPASVFAIGIAPTRRPNSVSVADFMVPKGGKQNKNRYQPLAALDDIDLKSPSGPPSELKPLSGVGINAVNRSSGSACPEHFPGLPGGDNGAASSFVDMVAPQNALLKNPMLSVWSSTSISTHVPTHMPTNTSHTPILSPPIVSHLYCHRRRRLSAQRPLRA